MMTVCYGLVVAYIVLFITFQVLYLTEWCRETYMIMYLWSSVIVPCICYRLMCMLCCICMCVGVFHIHVYVVFPKLIDVWY